MKIQADFSSLDSAITAMTDRLKVLDESVKGLQVTFNTFTDAKLIGSLSKTNDSLQKLFSTFNPLNTSLKNVADNFKNIKSASFNKKIALSAERTGTLATTTLRLSKNTEKYTETVKLAKTAVKGYVNALSKAINSGSLEKKMKRLEAVFDGFIKVVEKATADLEMLRKSTQLVSYDKLATNVRKTNKELDALNKTVKSSHTNMKFLIHMAAYRAFSRLTMYIRQSITTLLEFNKALHEIDSVIGGGINLKKLEDSVRSLAATFGYAKTEITEALYQIISLRYADSTDAITKLNSVMVGAITLNTSLKDVVETVATAYNNFGDALGTTDNIMAIFSKSIQLGKMRLSELSNIVGTMFPLAQNLGVAMQAVMSAMDTFTIKGMSAAKAGTQIRALFIALIKPTTRLQAAYDSLGVATAKQGIALYGLGGFLKKINEHFDGNIALLGKAIGRQRALNAFVSLSAKNFSSYEDSLKATNRAMADYVKIQKSPDEIDAKKFEKSIQNLKNAFEKNFTKPFMDMITSINEKFGPLIDDFFRLGAVVVKVGLAFYAFKQVQKFNSYLLKSTILGKTMGKIWKANARTYKILLKAKMADKTVTKSLVTAQKNLAIQTEFGSKMNIFYAKSFVALRKTGIKSMIMLGLSMRTLAKVGKMALSGLVTAFKTAVASTIYGLALVAVSYLIEKIMEAFAEAEGALNKFDENLRGSMQSMSNMISLSIEKNQRDASEALKKVRSEYEYSINRAQKAYNDALAKVPTKELITKMTKDNNTLIASITKTFRTLIGESSKAVRALENDLKKINSLLKATVKTYSEKVTGYFGNLKVKISAYLDRQSYAKAKKQLATLIQENNTPLGTDLSDDELKKAKEKRAEKEKEIALLREQLHIMDLFKNKKIPSLYTGLDLNHTKIALQKIKKTLDSYQKNIKSQDQVSFGSFTGTDYKVELEKQKQIIADMITLKEKYAEAGLNTKRIDKALAKEKAYYKDNLNAYKKNVEDKLAAEKARLEELKTSLSAFNKAYEAGDSSAMRNIAKTVGGELQIKLEQAAQNADFFNMFKESNVKAEKARQELNSLVNQQLARLDAIKKNLTINNAIEKLKLSKVENRTQTQIDLNDITRTAKESDYLSLEKALKNMPFVQPLVEGGKTLDMQVLINQIKRGQIDSLEMFKKLSEAGAKTNTMDIVGKMIEAISNALKRDNVIEEKSNNIENRTVTPPTATENNSLTSNKLKIEIQDKRKNEFVVKLDGKILAREILKTMDTIPNLNYRMA